jgi:uncharacterized protein
MRSKSIPTVLAAGILSVGFALSASAGDGKIPEKLSIASGVSGGNQYIMAVGISKILGDKGAKVNVETGGAVGNVMAVSKGDVEIGMTFDFVPAMGRAGEKPFPAKVTNVRGVAGFPPSFTHVLVAQDSGIKTFADLKGKKFATQRVGTGSQYAFAKLLLAHGLTEKDLQLFVGGQSYAVNNIKDRNVVGMTATTAFPGSKITELMTTRRMRFLEVGDEAYAKIKEINPGLIRFTLPAGTYRDQDADLPGIGTGTIFVARDNMPEEEAYWLSKTMAENVAALRKVHGSLKKMTKENVAAFGGLEPHPGSLRYFKEAGLR